MNFLQQLLTIGTILLAGYAIFTIFLLLKTILEHRDELYKSKYEDFILQKNRALEEIKRKRKNVR